MHIYAYIVNRERAMASDARKQEWTGRAARRSFPLHATRLAIRSSGF